MRNIVLTEGQLNKVILETAKRILHEGKSEYFQKELEKWKATPQISEKRKQQVRDAAIRLGIPVNGITVGNDEQIIELYSEDDDEEPYAYAKGFSFSLSAAPKENIQEFMDLLEDSIFTRKTDWDKTTLSNYEYYYSIASIFSEEILYAQESQDDNYDFFDNNYDEGWDDDNDEDLDDDYEEDWNDDEYLDDDYDAEY